MWCCFVYFCKIAFIFIWQHPLKLKKEKIKFWHELIFHKSWGIKKGNCHCISTRLCPWNLLTCRNWLVTHFWKRVLCGPFPYKMWGNRTGLKIKLVQAWLNFLDFLNFEFGMYFVQKLYIGSVFAVCYQRIFAVSMHCLKESLLPINKTGAKESTHVTVGEESSFGLV